MVGELIVRPDKNEFLLYAMLNALGLARGKPDDHPIKRETVNHFQGYTGLGLKEKDYGHHSKPVAYVLTLNEAPDFSTREGLVSDKFMQSEVYFGKSVLPHLKHFFEHTDFEDFYAKILPRYTEECDTLQTTLDNVNLVDLLDEAWKLDGSFKMEVIPMPLEATSSGIGPSIGDTAYQIIGPPFNYSIVHLIAHEGSHPRAKKTLAPIKENIEARAHLLKNAIEHPNYSSSYHQWSICFEEHLIRAVQAMYIDPILNDNANIVTQLQREENRKGMVFIKDFYEELQKDKNAPLADTALRILDRLDQYT